MSISYSFEDQGSSLFALVKEATVAKLQNAGLTLADLDRENSGGQSFFSLIKNHRDQSLLDYCFNVVKRDIASDTKGRSLLHWAAKCNQPENVIQEIITSGITIDDANNPFQVTPLYIASMEGNLTSVAALIKLGANVGASAINGATPLHAAAQGGSVDCMKALMNAGADANADCDDNGSVILAAVMSNNPRAVDLLVAAKVDVNRALNNGATPLMVAAQNGNLEIIQTLIAAGADTSLKTVDGLSALDVAKNNGHLNCVDVL